MPAHAGTKKNAKALALNQALGLSRIEKPRTGRAPQIEPCDFGVSVALKRPLLAQSRARGYCMCYRFGRRWI